MSSCFWIILLLLGCNNTRFSNNGSCGCNRSYNDYSRRSENTYRFSNNYERTSSNNNSCDCGCSNYNGERQGQYSTTTSNGCDCGC